MTLSDRRSAGEPGGSLLVGQVMTREVVTARPEMSVLAAARLMARRDVSGLPVVDHDGRLVGIASDGDVIVYPRARASRRPWWRRFLSGDRSLRRELHRFWGTTVGEVMTSPVVAVRADLALALAAVLMTRRGVRRVPVVDADQRVIGVVSRSDVVRAVARGVEMSAPMVLELLARGLRPAATRTGPDEDRPGAP